VAEYDPVAILRALVAAQVRFVVIGGVAARLRGAPLLTDDVDVTPARDGGNLEAIARALDALDAGLRTANEPDGVTFPHDPVLLAANDSWTLVTRSGDLDLVFRPAGTDGYADLIRAADLLTIAPDVQVPVASLPDVIRSKEASGRAKDRAVLPLLRQTLDELAGP